MKVAIVHYWLVGMRGGEKVVEALLDLFPTATIITHVYDPDSVSARIRSANIRETFIGRLPKARRLYQKYLPLMPLALEQVDMTEFDLVISSESGPAKGIIPRPDALHLCYCHTPMRYIWDHYHIYRGTAGRLTRTMMPVLTHRLRIWDVSSAARVDKFVANSAFVAARIEKYYRRDAQVIPPPVAVNDFSISPEVGDNYLYAGELIPYKRPDLAIEAFSASGRKLTIIGEGEMRAALEAQSGPNITFLGRVSGETLKREYARCRALIFPGEEDFGIIPVEAMASGRPIVAYGRGGVCDTVLPGETGVFFDQPTPEALNHAIADLEAQPGLLEAPERIRAHAEQFDVARFKERMRAVIDEALKARGITP